MATSKFFIVDNPEDGSDGVIQSRTKDIVGLAWNKPAPDGGYIKCSLDGYWLVSEEDYKKLSKLKKHEIKNNKRNIEGATR